MCAGRRHQIIDRGEILLGLKFSGIAPRRQAFGWSRGKCPAILAVAATLGAANSLYAVIDGRRRELATLRALGFRAGPIVASVLTESILLALPGALLSTGLAWLLFNGLAASPFGFAFHMAVTVPVTALGICWSLAMGLLGGLFPAVKSVCVPVTAGLQTV